MPLYRPTWVDVSISNFLHNLSQVKQWVGPSVHVLPVLKADGYGHGAVALAEAAERQNIPLIGVSSLEEGISLREAGVKTPILILGGVFPLENFSVAIDQQFLPTVASLEAAQTLKKMADMKNSGPVSFHIKVDTGMGRIGVSVEGSKALLRWVKDQPRLQLAGLYTHFAAADSDLEFTKFQLDQFHRVKSDAEALGFRNLICHVSNSAGVLFGPPAHFNLVRPGLMLYGAMPIPGSLPFSLKPVLSWKSQAIFFKRVPAHTSISYGRTYVTAEDSDIITVPVGYADGVPRSVSNNGFVLVRGRRCPIVGRVTMDHIMVNVTGLAVSVGESVVLIGEQNGQSLTVQDWAHWAGTIPYEIFCGISKRVPRKVVS